MGASGRQRLMRSAPVVVYVGYLRMYIMESDYLLIYNKKVNIAVFKEL